MKYTYLLVLIFLFSCTSGKIKKNGNQDFSDLNTYIDKIVEFQKGAGSVVLMKGDDVVYKRHFSFNKLPQEPLLRIGSITKTYTATIILKLMEEGKLKLDDKLSEFFPEIMYADQITIEHLLRHRSGLQNFTDLPEYLKYHEKPQAMSKHLARFKKLKLDFPPGTKYSYSNTGYVLLTFIAEKISKKKYSDLLDIYITGPLKLKHTYVYSKSRPAKDEVGSFVRSAKWEKGSNTDETVPLGAGAIVASAQDVAIFLHYLLHGNLLKEDSKKMMMDLKDGYGLGLISFPYNKKIAYGHTGGIDGFRSIAGYFPDDNLTMVQVMNAIDLTFNDFSIAILASYHGDEVKLPDYKNQLMIDPKVLANYVGTFGAKDFPLKLNIFVKDGQLFGQATGQPSFLMSALSQDEFEFKQAALKIKFLELGKKLELNQGKTFTLIKE